MVPSPGSSRPDPPVPADRGGPDPGRRELILRAAAELIAAQGYEALTPAQIARRAGVSAADFGSCFEGKEDCLAALLRGRMSDLRTGLAVSRSATRGEPWPRQVSAALRTVLEALLADPLLTRATIVEAPGVGPALLESYQEELQGLVPLLREGRIAGEDAAALPPTLEETLAAGVFWSAYQQLLGDEDTGLAALLPGSLEFVLRPFLGAAEARRWARGAAQEAGADPDPPAVG
jgi:AcrR family transcriptional regulator